LFVLVDKFSNMCILLVCKKSNVGEEATSLFFERFWVRFGMPRSISFDRNTRFPGTFWTSLWENLDTKLKRFTMFHPHTDGQMKVVTRTFV
jgi:hypothetical protein